MNSGGVSAPPERPDVDVATPTQPRATSHTSATIVKLAVLLALGTGLLVTLHIPPVSSRVLDLRAFVAAHDGGSIKSEVLFFLITAAVITLGAPRLLFYTAGGILFGVVEGFFVATGASLLGSFLTFRAIRWAGRKWVKARFGNHRFFQRIIGTRPTTLAVFLVRQLPVGNVFINGGLALSRVRNRAFILGSCLGFAPQGIVAALIGGGMADDTLHEGLIQLIAAAVGLFGISFSVWLARKRACSSPDTCDAHRS